MTDAQFTELKNLLTQLVGQNAAPTNNLSAAISQLSGSIDGFGNSNVFEGLRELAGRLEGVELSFDEALDRISNLGDIFDALENKINDAVTHLGTYSDIVASDLSSVNNIMSKIESLTNEFQTANQARQNEIKDEIKELTNLANLQKAKGGKDKSEWVGTKKDALNKDVNQQILNDFGGRFGQWTNSLNKYGKMVQMKGAATGSKGMINMGGAMSKASAGITKAAPYLAAVQIIDQVVGAITKKFLEFQKLKTENYIRTLNAETLKFGNAVNTVVGIVTNGSDALYGATSSAIESQKAELNAKAENALAEQKFWHTFTNDIPIIRSINQLSEQRQEMVRQKGMAEIDAAQKNIDKINEIIKTQDKALGEFDKMTRTFQKSFGIPESKMNDFRKSMSSAGVELAQFGVKLEDALNAQMSISESTGRNQNWSKDDMSQVMAVGKIVGQDNVNAMISGAEVFGKGAKESADITMKMYNEANRAGLNATKHIKNVTANLKMAEKYNFKGGVEGFAKMAKWAETARVELSTIASVTDKVQNGGLEGVLKQSAQLQVMGGQAATGSDPLSMMYNAMYDPEQYAKDMVKAVSDLGRFNKETGDMDFEGTAVQLKAIADAYGISVGEAKNMARAENKKQQIEAKSNGRLSEEEVEQFANKATYDKERGEYVVKVMGADGQFVSKTVDQMTSEDFTKTEDREAIEIAKATLSAEEQVAANTMESNMLLAAMGGMEEYFALQKKANQDSKESNALMREQYQTNASAAHEIMHQSAQTQINQIKTMGAMKQNVDKIQAATANIETAATGKKSTGERAASVAGGALVGAAAGAAFGPIGMGIGALIGAGIGFFSDGMITRDGKMVKIDDEDDVLAAKSGGVIDRVLGSNTKGGHIDDNKDNPIGKKPDAAEFVAQTIIIKSNTVSRETVSRDDSRYDDETKRTNDSLIGSILKPKSQITEGGEVGGRFPSSGFGKGVLTGSGVGDPNDGVFGGLIGDTTDLFGGKKPQQTDIRPTNDKSIDINIKGTLNLSGENGQNVNIIDLIKNDLNLQKALAKLVADEMSRSINGGKHGYAGNTFYNNA